MTCHTVPATGNSKSSTQTNWRSIVANRRNYKPNGRSRGPTLAITVLVYYAVRVVVFLIVTTVVVCTKDDKRREACLRLAELVSRGWPRLARLPGS
jgi:hypothetical protein